MRLVGANLNYSSWTMRAWLALRLAGAEFKFFDVGLKTEDGWKERIEQFSGAGKVPVLIDGNLSIHESLAIGEYLAELHPEAKLWPEDLALRARGRAISCEMLSGFLALRSQMPCNVRARAARTPGGDALEQDIARVLSIWEASLSTSPGAFLLGDHMTLADCMYMPVVTRFRTYGVALPDFAQRYSETVFEHPFVKEVTEAGADGPAIAEYDAFLEP